MNAATRRVNAAIEAARSCYGDALREIPRSDWPPALSQAQSLGITPPLRVWCSRRYTVLLFGDNRLSASIARIGDDGRFQDGMTWDDLQRLKAEAGFGDRWAVEVFPPDSQVVNVSNMRHLWLLDEAPPFAWLALKGEANG